MNNTTDIFDKAKIEVQKLWANHKELSNFVNFPKNLVLNSLKSQKTSVTDKLFNWNKNLNTKLLELHKAISDLSPYVNWEQGYKEKEVGKDFLNKYGFFELIGPTGHFQTSEMALYVNFLDKNAYYPWHNHEAEELYFIVSGEAKFESKNQKEEILSSTKTRFHKSYQPHAITTSDQQILSFVIWKNKFENISKIVQQ